MGDFEIIYKSFAVVFTIIVSIILIMDKSKVKRLLNKSVNKFKNK